MNGRAWAVEVSFEGDWVARAIWSTRQKARDSARAWRKSMRVAARVRQYIRQQETRP